MCRTLKAKYCWIFGQGQMEARIEKPERDLQNFKDVQDTDSKIMLDF
jgi:hypothetical protein